MPDLLSLRDEIASRIYGEVLAIAGYAPEGDLAWGRIREVSREAYRGHADAVLGVLTTRIRMSFAESLRAHGGRLDVVDVRRVLDGVLGVAPTTPEPHDPERCVCMRCSDLRVASLPTHDQEQP